MQKLLQAFSYFYLAPQIHIGFLTTYLGFEHPGSSFPMTTAWRLPLKGPSQKPAFNHGQMLTTMDRFWLQGTNLNIWNLTQDFCLILLVKKTLHQLIWIHQDQGNVLQPFFCIGVSGICLSNIIIFYQYIWCHLTTSCYSLGQWHHQKLREKWYRLSNNWKMDWRWQCWKYWIPGTAWGTRQMIEQSGTPKSLDMVIHPWSSLIYLFRQRLSLLINISIHNWTIMPSQFSLS